LKIYKYNFYEQTKTYSDSFYLIHIDNQWEALIGYLTEFSFSECFDIDFEASFYGSLQAGLLADLEAFSLNIRSITPMSFDFNNTKSESYWVDTNNNFKLNRSFGIGILSWIQNTTKAKNSFYSDRDLTTNSININFLINQGSINFDENWNLNSFKVGFGTNFSFLAIGGGEVGNFFGIRIKF